MSSLIPIKIAELAVETLENEIKKLKEENNLLKEAGKSLSLKIHKSQKFSDFYPELGDFERLIDPSRATNGCCINRPAMGKARGLCKGPCGTGKQEDGGTGNV